MAKLQFIKDYYAILGVNATAEESLIHAAYSVKTRLYHPDSAEANESGIKLSDINEAYAVLGNPTTRAAYDAARAEKDADSEGDVPGLPRLQAKEFEYPVFVFKPKINLSKAQTLFVESFKRAATKLPQGADIKALVSCVYIPAWFVSGTASGEWRAAGVTLDTQEVTCTKCGGKGVIEGEGFTPQCPLCQGSGKIDRRQSKKSMESGATKASVSEYVSSTYAGLDFKPDFSKVTRPAKATPEMLSDLYFLQPEQDHEKAKELLNERLALALKNKALEGLSQYDSVEGPHFRSTDAHASNKLELRFYPVYVCQYAGSTSKRFAVCDGITGETDTPQQENLWGLFKNVLILAGLAGVLWAAAYYGKGLLGNGDPAKPGAIGKVSAQIMVDRDMLKQLIPSVKKPENEAAPKRALIPGVPKPVAPKPVKKETAAQPVNKNQEKPSFDCATARVKAEKLICASKELVVEDKKLAAVFEQRKQSASFEASRNKLIVEQMTWVEHVRNSCVNDTCLLNAYHKRMEALSDTSEGKKPEACPIPGHC